MFEWTKVQAKLRDTNDAQEKQNSKIHLTRKMANNNIINSSIFCMRNVEVLKRKRGCKHLTVEI